MFTPSSNFNFTRAHTYTDALVTSWWGLGVYWLLLSAAAGHRNHHQPGMTVSPLMAPITVCRNRQTTLKQRFLQRRRKRCLSSGQETADYPPSRRNLNVDVTSSHLPPTEWPTGIKGLGTLCGRELPEYMWCRLHNRRSRKSNEMFIFG